MLADGMALFVESVQCNILSLTSRIIKKKIGLHNFVKQSITAY